MNSKSRQRKEGLQSAITRVRYSPPGFVTAGPLDDKEGKLGHRTISAQGNARAKVESVRRVSQTARLVWITPAVGLEVAREVAGQIVRTFVDRAKAAMDPLSSTKGSV